MLKWLAEHPRVTRFAIIDDEDDELDDLVLFQPSCKTGITPEIVKGVERYLSGKTDETMRLNAMYGWNKTFTRYLRGITADLEPFLV